MTTTTCWIFVVPAVCGGRNETFVVDSDVAEWAVQPERRIRIAGTTCRTNVRTLLVVNGGVRRLLTVEEEVERILCRNRDERGWLLREVEAVHNRRGAHVGCAEASQPEVVLDKLQNAAELVLRFGNVMLARI